MKLLWIPKLQPLHPPLPHQPPPKKKIKKLYFVMEVVKHLLYLLNSQALYIAYKYHEK